MSELAQPQAETPIQGRIHSLRAGTYAVMMEAGMLQCRARGKFRNEGITPLVGDLVAVDDLGGGEGFIKAVLPRKNALKRPPLANLDQLFLLCSVAEPAPNLRLLDTLAAVAELCDIEPVIVFTKCDLSDRCAAALVDIYRAFRCFALSFGDSTEAIKELLKGKLSAFCGNTGVGKSTLLNKLAAELQLPTGEISQKLGRGRHTTRHVELFPVGGGWVADTPGFGAIELDGLDNLTKESLPLCFREFLPYLDQCRFPDCAHTKDKGCRILEAVGAGEIPRSRWESYGALYNELKQKTAY